jgi:branched-chain amino acid transport system substrate-binding protein
MTLTRLLAVVAAFALWGCGKTETPATDTSKPADANQAAAPAAPAEPALPTVKIGLAVPLTGPQAHLGIEIRDGAQLALDEANEAGVTLGGQKVKFELMAEDDEANPSKATIVAQKLVDAKVAGVVGHMNSGTSIPASKIYSDNAIPHISPSATNPKLTEQGFKTTFRVMANDNQQGKVLGDFAVSKLGMKSMVIIDDRTAYGKGLADVVERTVKGAGKPAAAREFTDDKSTDFQAILTSAKGKKPDVIFFGGMDPQGGPMAKQMKSLGIKAKLVAGDGMQTPNFIQLAGADAEGHYASSPGVPLDKMASGSAFADKLVAKYKTKIELYAPYGYDAAALFVAAMKQADSSDPAKYLPALAGITHTGVTGPIGFDEKGDLKGGLITIYQVKDGKWMPVETIGGG